MYLYMKGRLHRTGIAVDVDAVDVAVDDCLPALDFLEIRDFVEFGADEREDKPHQLKESGALQDADVHQSVTDRSKGGNVGVIAVLGGVGETEDEAVHVHRLALTDDFVSLFRVAEPQFHSSIDIGEDASEFLGAEFMRHLRIEAYAADVEGVFAVDGQHVDAGIAVNQHLAQCPVDENGISQMPGESVPAADGDYGKSDVAATKGATYFIDGAVPPDHHDVRVLPGFPDFLDQFPRMPRIAGEDRVIRNLTVLRQTLKGMGNTLPLAHSGNRIDNK